MVAAIPLRPFLTKPAFTFCPNDFVGVINHPQHEMIGFAIDDI
jgi:hypothetical protein